MTPKEKANELVEKFLCVDDNEDLFCDECGMSEKAAKLCALISIEFAREFITGDLSERFDKTMYLLEVKEELLKLVKEELLKL
jgi:hypothetical protein